MTWSNSIAIIQPTVATEEGGAMLKEFKKSVMLGNVLDMATDSQFYYAAFNVPEKK